MSEFASLRDLQNGTREGDVIVDSKGREWTKNERNWWQSDRGEEVLPSFFFDYGIKVSFADEQ